MRADTQLTLTIDDLRKLQSTHDPISLDEVVAIYLPLSRLLALYVAATQGLFKATQRFLGAADRPDETLDFARSSEPGVADPLAADLSAAISAIRSQQSNGFPIKIGALGVSWTGAGAIFAVHSPGGRPGARLRHVQLAAQATGENTARCRGC